MQWRLFSILLLFCAPTADAGELVRKGDGAAVEIVDGDTLVLKSGDQVRLVGCKRRSCRSAGKAFAPGRWRMNPAAGSRSLPLAAG